MRSLKMIQTDPFCEWMLAEGVFNDIGNRVLYH